MENGSIKKMPYYIILHAFMKYLKKFQRLCQKFNMKKQNPITINMIYEKFH